MLTAAGLLFLATRPQIVLRERSGSVGEKSFLWADVERIQSGAWASLLLLRVSLRGGRIVNVIYPGEPETSARLMRQLRRLLRGVRSEPVAEPEMAAAEISGDRPKYRVVRPEEEAEIERMFQRLKSAGRPDHQTSSEERD